MGCYLSSDDGGIEDGDRDEDEEGRRLDESGLEVGCERAPTILLLTTLDVLYSAWTNVNN